MTDTQRLNKLEALGCVEIECTVDDQYAVGDQIEAEEYHPTLRAAIDAMKEDTPK